MAPLTEFIKNLLQRYTDGGQILKVRRCHKKIAFSGGMSITEVCLHKKITTFLLV